MTELFMTELCTILPVCNDFRTIKSTEFCMILANACPLFLLRLFFLSPMPSQQNLVLVLYSFDINDTESNRHLLNVNDVILLQPL